MYIRVRIATCGYCGTWLAARVDGSTAVVGKLTAVGRGQLLTTHISTIEFATALLVLARLAPIGFSDLEAGTR